MSSIKSFVINSLAPAFAVMLVCFLGSFLVYKSFYSGQSSLAVSLTEMAPAAGEDMLYEGALPLHSDAPVHGDSPAPLY